MFLLFLCLLRRKIRFFEVLLEQCAEQCSELYRRIFWYCSDRKRAGDFAYPFDVTSVEKV